MLEKKKWYACGLHFECMQCGRCCSGPNQGYIWVTRPEIKLIADFLKVEPKQLRQTYLRRVGLRITIIEQSATKDCVFLRRVDGQRRCVIYPARPSQCRAWPFWPDNLTDADDWNRAAQKCSGINHGRFFSFDEIEKIRKSKKWWQHVETNNQLLKKVAEVYRWLDSQIHESAHLAGICDACGKCCDFAKFDHRLFVTPPEMMYLAANLGAALTAETAESAEKKEKNKNKIKRSDNTKNLGVLCELSDKRKMSWCPYNIDGKCSVYEHRFSGCRIFSCKGDADFQSGLSERTLKEFKAICEQFQIPYRYTDLATALNEVVVA